MSPLRIPPDPIQLAIDFPHYHLTTTLQLARIHKSGRGPWWFASVDADPHRSGRFDLPQPKGTCYLAESPKGAFLESLQHLIGVGNPIPISEMLIRSVSTLTAPRKMRIADCTHKAAAAFGITGAISSGGDRLLTQQWAIAFDAAGFEGIRYFAQGDPSQHEVSIALFHDAGSASWAIGLTEPIKVGLIADIERQFNIKVR